MRRTDGKQFHEDPIYTEIRASLDRFARELTDDPTRSFINPFPSDTAGALGAKAIGLSHPLGGCGMGQTAERGVVDEFGRVFDTLQARRPPVPRGPVHRRRLLHSHGARSEPVAHHRRTRPAHGGRNNRRAAGSGAANAGDRARPVMSRRPKAVLPWILALPCAVALGLVGLSACGSGQDNSRVDPAADVVALPGAMRGIDFDDIVYSERLARVLVPARRSGLYLIDPASDEAERVGRVRSADSADEGQGLLFVLDREDGVVNVLDPKRGRVMASVSTASPGDYLRYVGPTQELWITEPAASPPGIEIFALPEGATPTPRHAAFVPVPNGPEGLVWSAATSKAYTHAGTDVVAIDLRSRSVTARWPTSCSGTHGFPRVDERDRLLLASCADDGKVVLLDIDDGRRLGRYAVGGGEALPGYSSRADHFYVRADPGTRLATLAPSSHGLRVVSEVDVPEVGHCLTADGVGHYWTCDADGGRVLRFDDR